MHFLANDLLVDVANMMYDVTETLVDAYHNEGDFEGFEFDLIRSFSMDSPVPQQEFIKEIPDELRMQSMQRFLTLINEKLKQYRSRHIRF